MEADWPKEEELLRELPDFGLSALYDPLAIRESLLDVGGRLARNPIGTFAAGVRWGFGVVEAAAAAGTKALGGEADGPAEIEPGDTRFADPTWTENPAYFGLLQSYLVTARLLRDLLGAAGPNGVQTQKASFVTEQVIDALAPTNFLPTNPTALKRAFETGGTSVLRGAQRFVEDLVENGGFPRQVDEKAFTVGQDLAATPGKVVYRNRLMELIQYEPQTETVFEVPILLSPPWINKYYVMDLAPGKSFAEWAVQHGHTVFCISYCNPDESLRDVRLEDYLLEGPLEALDVIADITGASQINVASLCLGGTLATILLAHLAARGDSRVQSATLINTLVDFSEPGALGCFVDPLSLERLQKRMEQRGFLEGKEMATAFNLLRSRDLIWRYVVASWLMGEAPPAFDILAWNCDSTRMPARMHSEYLRMCYLDNALAKGELELAGTQIDLGKIEAPMYIVAAAEDHIALWRSSYMTTQLVGGDPRFVLSSSGHVAGIVNPPNPKRKYWTNEALPPDPDVWLEGTEQHPSSWWEDWVVWVESQAGARREPPPLGSEKYPPLADAPGSYVLEK